MDTFWAFRKASVHRFNPSSLILFKLTLKLVSPRYDTARQLKEKQDAFCHKAHVGDWDSIGSQSFPEDLQWEALVDVLRGRVKVRLSCLIPLLIAHERKQVQTHCYEAVDLDDLVRVCSFH